MLSFAVIQHKYITRVKVAKKKKLKKRKTKRKIKDFGWREEQAITLG